MLKNEDAKDAMKNPEKIPAQILANTSLFEKIHQLKHSFISVFSEIANEISSGELMKLHPGSQGIKISRGNELQHCPYQVLDIIRDFTKDHGFNIRILNWWGRGLFIFVFFGRNNPKIYADFTNFSEMNKQGFLLAETASPWDYKNMIDLGNLKPIVHELQLKTHVRDYRYLQLVKKIDYPEDFLTLKVNLQSQVWKILNLYSR